MRKISGYRIGLGMRFFVLLLMAGLGFAAEWRLGPAAENTVDLYVDKTGLMAGKRHWFRFPEFTGTVRTEPGRVEIEFAVGAMQCFDTWLSAKDQKKVLEYALGKETLDAARYRAVRFVSTGVAGEQVTGTLTIRGVSRPVTVTVTQAGEGRYEGSAVFKMTDFGIKPAKAALGAVGTRDEMTLRFQLQGLRQATPAP
jgi:polyisoprenoid-binding protein YceI